MSTTTAPQSRTTGSKPSANGKAGEGAPDGDENGAKKKGKRVGKGGLFKSKKFILAVVGVLVVGGGAYKFLMPHKAAPPTGGDVVPIDAMTVNLAAGHYLKVAVAVQLVKGKASATSFDTSHAAELVIDEFSNRQITLIDTNAERKKLTADLLTQLKKAYPGEVYAAFLTQFVAQ